MLRNEIQIGDLLFLPYADDIYVGYALKVIELHTDKFISRILNNRYKNAMIYLRYDDVHLRKMTDDDKIHLL